MNQQNAEDYFNEYQITVHLDQFIIAKATYFG